jgi:3'(2'), 5'-bisphosphate nucleotidase
VARHPWRGAASGRVNASERAALLPDIVALARAAGDVALRWYNDKDCAVRAKADESPVTDADEASEAVILAGLKRLTPNIPVVSEEATSRGETDAGCHDARYFWLVDPLDGTREFVGRSGEFAVNIGLIEDRKPVLGVLHGPVSGVSYFSDGVSAQMRRGDAAIETIHARRAPANGLVVVSSRSHGDKSALAAYLEDYKIAARKISGSALKFGLLACGEADLYPRLGKTMEWDTAAGHAILNAAGGDVRTLAGHELLYGKPGFKNPDFVARGVP